MALVRWRPDREIGAFLQHARVRGGAYFCDAFRDRWQMVLGHIWMSWEQQGKEYGSIG